MKHEVYLHGRRMWRTAQELKKGFAYSVTVINVGQPPGLRMLYYASLEWEGGRYSGIA